MTTRQDTRKSLPRKSTAATPSSHILDEPPLSVEEGDALAQTKVVVEKETKEKSTKKQKIQK